MFPPRDPEPEPSPPVDRRAGARRADILAVVRAAREGLGIRALAEATGLHENTVRFHLDRLVADGLLERRAGTSRGPGRPPLLFVARREQHGAGHDNYELLARVLATQVGAAGDPTTVAREAGRAWGRDQAAVRDVIPPAAWDEALDELARVLDGAGFAPEVAEQPGGAEVRLHTCPFLRLAREDRAVPCAVHLGLMDGLLEGMGWDGAVERLEPFATPTLCVAHLRAAAPSAS